MNVGSTDTKEASLPSLRSYLIQDRPGDFRKRLGSYVLCYELFLHSVTEAQPYKDDGQKRKKILAWVNELTTLQPLSEAMKLQAWMDKVSQVVLQRFPKDNWSYKDTKKQLGPPGAPQQLRVRGLRQAQSSSNLTDSTRVDDQFLLAFVAYLFDIKDAQGGIDIIHSLLKTVDVCFQKDIFPAKPTLFQQYPWTAHVCIYFLFIVVIGKVRLWLDKNVTSQPVKYQWCSIPFFLECAIRVLERFTGFSDQRRRVHMAQVVKTETYMKHIQNAYNWDAVKYGAFTNTVDQQGKKRNAANKDHPFYPCATDADQILFKCIQLIHFFEAAFDQALSASSPLRTESVDAANQHVAETERVVDAIVGRKKGYFSSTASVQDGFLLQNVVEKDFEILLIEPEQQQQQKYRQLYEDRKNNLLTRWIGDNHPETQRSRVNSYSRALDQYSLSYPSIFSGVFYRGKDDAVVLKLQQMFKIDGVEENVRLTCTYALVIALQTARRTIKDNRDTSLIDRILSSQQRRRRQTATLTTPSTCLAFAKSFVSFIKTSVHRLDYALLRKLVDLPDLVYSEPLLYVLCAYAATDDKVRTPFEAAYRSFVKLFPENLFGSFHDDMLAYFVRACLCPELFQYVQDYVKRDTGYDFMSALLPSGPDRIRIFQMHLRVMEFFGPYDTLFDPQPFLIFRQVMNGAFPVFFSETYVKLLIRLAKTTKKDQIPTLEELNGVALQRRKRKEKTDGLSPIWIIPSSLKTKESTTSSSSGRLVSLRPNPFVYENTAKNVYYTTPRESLTPIFIHDGLHFLPVEIVANAKLIETQGLDFLVRIGVFRVVRPMTDNQNPNKSVYRCVLDFVLALGISCPVEATAQNTQKTPGKDLHLLISFCVLPQPFSRDERGELMHKELHHFIDNVMPKFVIRIPGLGNAMNQADVARTTWQQMLEQFQPQTVFDVLPFLSQQWAKTHLQKVGRGWNLVAKTTSLLSVGYGVTTQTLKWATKGTCYWILEKLVGVVSVLPLLAELVLVHLRLCGRGSNIDDISRAWEEWITLQLKDISVAAWTWVVRLLSVRQTSLREMIRAQILMVCQILRTVTRHFAVMVPVYDVVTRASPTRKKTSGISSEVREINRKFYDYWKTRKKYNVTLPDVLMTKERLLAQTATTPQSTQRQHIDLSLKQLEMIQKRYAGLPTSKVSTKRLRLDPKRQKNAIEQIQKTTTIEAIIPKSNESGNLSLKLKYKDEIIKIRISPTLILHTFENARVGEPPAFMTGQYLAFDLTVIRSGTRRRTVFLCWAFVKKILTLSYFIADTTEERIAYVNQLKTMTPDQWQKGNAWKIDVTLFPDHPESARWRELLGVKEETTRSLRDMIRWKQKLSPLSTASAIDDEMISKQWLAGLHHLIMSGRSGTSAPPVFRSTKRSMIKLPMLKRKNGSKLVTYEVDNDLSTILFRVWRLHASLPGELIMTAALTPDTLKVSDVGSAAAGKEIRSQKELQQAFVFTLLSEVDLDRWLATFGNPLKITWTRMHDLLRRFSPVSINPLSLTDVNNLVSAIYKMLRAQDTSGLRLLLIFIFQNLHFAVYLGILIFLKTDANFSIVNSNAEFLMLYVQQPVQDLLKSIQLYDIIRIILGAVVFQLVLCKIRKGDPGVDR